MTDWGALTDGVIHTCTEVFGHSTSALIEYTVEGDSDTVVPIYRSSHRREDPQTGAVEIHTESPVLGFREADLKRRPVPDVDFATVDGVKYTIVEVMTDNEAGLNLVLQRLP